ncbi:MAG: energy transducer TonB, partial [Pontibacter sp.]|nr:energy transducer TonB [Pontibacter sp.]
MKNNGTFYQLATAALLGLATMAAAPAALAQKTEKPYTAVEQMPEFKGGQTALLRFLGENIRYPEEAKKAGVEGLVVISFVIDADGSVSNTEVLKSLSNTTDAEASRVVEMTDGKWTPGRQNGKDVAVRYTLPIRFAIKAEDKAAAPDQQPQFKGGQEALLRSINQHLQLPEEAKQEHLNAKVVVRFTVEKDCTVSNIRMEHTKLKKTVGPGSELDYMDASTFNLQNKTILAKLAEAAAAAVKTTSGPWQPAPKSGAPVAAEVYLPVQFLGTAVESLGQSLREPAQPEASPQKKSAYQYEEVDEKPQLKDGPLEKFLAKNLRYPTSTALEGDVKLQFVVKEDGQMLGPLMQGSEDKRVTDEI